MAVLKADILSTRPFPPRECKTPAKPAATRPLRAAACLALLAFIALAEGPASRSTEAAATAGEYPLKSIFLYHFSQYVDWPDAVDKANNGRFVIGVLGDDPFEEHLDEIARAKTVRKKQIVIRRFKSVDDLDACHILFISSSEADKFGAIRAKLQGTGTLTVADSKGAVDAGVMINFVLVNSKVRFEINLAAAKAERLKVSSKLLRLADKVIDSDGVR